MYCKMCGKVNVATARFCCECGTKLPEPETQKASVSQSGSSAVNAAPSVNRAAAAPAATGASNPAPTAQAATPVYQSNRVSQAPGAAPTYTPNPAYQPNPAYSVSQAGAVPNMQVPMRNPDDDYVVRRVRVDRTPSVGGIIISILLIVACFIPYMKVEAWPFVQKMSFFETGLGAVVASGTIVAIVFSCLKVKWGLIGPGIGSIVCYLAQIIIFFSTTSSILSGYRIKITDYVHLQIGFFVVPILSVLLIICGASFSDNYRYERVRKGASDDLINKLNDRGTASNCWICCRCGTQNAMYVGTCKCGTVKTDPKNIMINGKPNKNYYASSIAKCPSCGRITSGNQTVCYECGARLIR